jgi:type I site-specific restriction endonuclease
MNRLLESELVHSILFLVDRKALAAQAVREFSAFNTPAGKQIHPGIRSLFPTVPARGFQR